MHGLFLGTGQFASVQLEAWNEVQGARIHSLYGRRAEAMQALTRAFRIPGGGTDLNAALAAKRSGLLVFADICTAAEAHLAHVRRCADAGLHLLCQKPLAPTPEDARACVEHCRQAGVRLMVHDNWRWQPWYRELKRLLEARTFGEVRSVHHTLRTGDGLGPTPYAAQPYFRELPRFLILETGIHYLDTYRYLFGEPDRIACITRRNNPAIRAEDQAIVTLRFPGGPVLVWDANRSVPTAHRKPPFNGTLRLEGTSASLEIDASGAMLIHPVDGPAYRHEYTVPAGYRGGSVVATLQHFVDCLRRDQPFETSGEDYLRTTALVFAAYAAAESGGTITLPT